MLSLKKQNLLLVTCVLLTLIFGSLFAFELVKGPTSTTITSLTVSTTTETETVTSYITNQLFRTASLTTPFTTSYPEYDNPFAFKAGDILISTWVIENGILLNVTCASSFKVGDNITFFMTMKNLNNTSHLSTLQSYGQFNAAIYDSKGRVKYKNWYLYAWGPTGPPPPNFSEGVSWTQFDWWNTKTSPQTVSGNYTLVARGQYLNVDFNKEGQIELYVPLTIS